MRPLIGLLMRALSLVVLASSCAAQSSQSAQTARSTELRAQGASDAAVIANLAEGSALQIIQRRGAWSEVRAADGRQGWVRMLHLRMAGGTAQPASASNAAGGTGGAAGGGAALNALAGILSPSRAGSSAVVTTGVRGLDEADLKNARPNPNELRRMQTFAASKPLGENFGRRSQLNSQRVDYLGPAVSSTGTRNGDASGSSSPHAPIDP